MSVDKKFMNDLFNLKIKKEKLSFTIKYFEVFFKDLKKEYQDINDEIYRRKNIIDGKEEEENEYSR